MLIVVVGPIASGKSTVAGAIGQRLRSTGRTVAVLDLDDLVDTLGGFATLDADRFEQAQTVFGRLVGAWLGAGVDVVAHGPFVDRDEQEALLAAVPDGVRPRRVLLTVPYEVALERVGRDPDRVLSRLPEILRAAHDRFGALQPTLPPNEWTFDTSRTSVETIVDEVAAAVLDGDGRS